MSLMEVNRLSRHVMHEIEKSDQLRQGKVLTLAGKDIYNLIISGAAFGYILLMCES